jgi:putative transport protein
MPTSLPIAHGVLVLCAVAVSGLALGAIKLRGLNLGVAGTLFAGIVFGHFGVNIDPAVRAFIQEFGLILFVYTIGIQVGPGFFTSLRHQGLPLNLCAAAVATLGAILTVSLCLLLNIDLAAGVGLFAGATTNTPALGAAQEALKGLPGLGQDRAALPGLGYAVAYPFGILGIILAMLLIRVAFRIQPARELERFRAEQSEPGAALDRMNLVVENPNLQGLSVRAVPAVEALRIVVSRIKKSGAAEVSAVTPDTLLGCGDVILAVGPRSNLDAFRAIVGRESSEDLTRLPGPVVARRVVITRKEMVGKTLRELGLDHVYGVTATRLTRADLEISVQADLKVQFGDMLMLVGPEDSIAKAAQTLGNSVKQLNYTNLIPLFVGIALGVVLGCYPFSIGHMPVPVRLGLAGGPLLAAIALSRMGKIGPLLWYVPVNVNTLLREFGIVLFLACVGLKSGTNFVHTLARGDGLIWMGVGAIITLVPLLVVAIVARVLLKMNYLTLCGLLAGSMTDPPALAFANTSSGSDAPSVSYATVYPLTMLLRIVLAQLIVIFFCR